MIGLQEICIRNVGRNKTYSILYNISAIKSKKDLKIIE
jgi:hypothetical protein